MMVREDKIKQLKMHEAYERYVKKVLGIMKKKFEIISEFRVKAGEMKLEKLKKEIGDK